MISHHQHVELNQSFNSIRLLIQARGSTDAEANFTRLYEQAAQALDKGNDSAYHKFKKVCSAYRLAAQNWEAFVDPFSTSCLKYQAYPFGHSPQGAIDSPTPGLPLLEDIVRAIAHLDKCESYETLYACITKTLSLADDEVSYLAQRSTAVVGDHPLLEPAKDFGLEHAAEVCRVLGRSLIIVHSIRGDIQHSFVTAPQPGASPIVLYNTAPLLGLRTSYHGIWYVLRRQAASKTSNEACSSASTHGLAPGASSNVFPPGAVPSSTPTASSNEVRQGTTSSSYVTQRPKFDPTAYGLRSKKVYSSGNTGQRSSPVPVASTRQQASASGSQIKSLAPREVILRIDKSSYLDLTGQKEVRDPMGRLNSTLFGQKPSLEEKERLVPLWNDEIASLIGETCPISLMSRDDCLKKKKKRGCLYKHICPGFKKTAVGDDSVTDYCESPELEHDGLVHIVPTCRNVLRDQPDGKADREPKDCGFGHDHLEVRSARRQVIQDHNKVFVQTNTNPSAVIHRIEYM